MHHYVLPCEPDFSSLVRKTDPPTVRRSSDREIHGYQPIHTQNMVARDETSRLGKMQVFADAPWEFAAGLAFALAMLKMTMVRATIGRLSRS